MFILIKFQKNPPIDFGKEHFYRFLPYMGMAAILVMLPSSFVYTFIPFNLFRLHIKFAFSWFLVK